jgi:putative sigma-54 modulation protein
MNIGITFRQMDATEAVKSHATEKIGRVQKFLRQPMQAQVTLSMEHRQHVVEVDVHSGPHHYHAREETVDMYASIDKVVDKLERQIRADKDNKKGAERASERLLPADE